MYVYIYIYIYTYVDIYIYMYICMCLMFVVVCVFLLSVCLFCSPGRQGARPQTPGRDPEYKRGGGCYRLRYCRLELLDK